MTFMIDVDKMPRNVLETVVKLNDSLKKNLCNIILF